MSEHDFEPIRGLPGHLPPGERILWQGAPDWFTLAQQAFHLRLVAAYFAVMLLWRIADALARGQEPLAAISGAALVAPIALVCIGILAVLAWLNSRTTVYTITNRRVVLRIGVALTKAINIPFSIIEGGALKALASGRGDVALTLKPPNKIALLQIWPHVRPWRFSAPQPTLRAVPNAGEVASILTSAISAYKPIQRSSVSIEVPTYDGDSTRDQPAIA